MNVLINLVVTIAKAITAFAIAAGVALAFVNVVARYLFESSFTWAGELTIYLFLWSTFFGAAYCFKKDAHIAVDVFLLKAPPKLAKFLTLLTLVISLIFVGAISYYGYEYVLLYIDLDEMSVDLNIPLWIPFAVVPISFGFSAIILIGKIVSTIKTPASKLHHKSEAEQLLEEMNTEQLLKEVHKKTGGML
jgi:C4-dicarboxylate transporter DctQ subunit